MRITFDHLQNNSNKTQAPVQANTAAKIAKSVYTSAGRGVIADAFGADDMRNSMRAYGKEKSVQDVQDEASLIDTAAYKNYMAVMSHTMSGEDFKELIKDGVHPGKVDVKDAVTIMDHIKASMAKSGVVIQGFNGAGDLSLEKLTEITGDAGYAQSIIAAFGANDIPLTEENVEQTMDAVGQAGQIEGLTDDVKQYLIQNELPATIDNVYRAMYSIGGAAQQSQGGYFADDTFGYYGKKPEEVDTAALQEQIEKVIEQSGLEVTQETKKQAFWMLERGVLLTEDNLHRLQKLEQISFPLEMEDMLSKIAGSLREGKAAIQTDIAEDGIYKKAEALYEQVQNISDEDLYTVVQSGETVNLKHLRDAQRDIRFSNNLQEKAQITAADTDSVQEEVQKNFIHEKRVLEEVRLKMTISANIMLLKSNYAIDTEPLMALVDALKEAESRQTDFGLSLPEGEKTLLYRETMEKRTALMDMPAAATARVMSAEDAFTLRHLHEEGSILKSAYDKAGESYEALMTRPRADFGDKISKAFSNIDELLSENGMEQSDENRRAVRILAYNQMEITRENIEKVAQADGMVTGLLNKMTPSATLNMIRDGVNPLDQTIPELTEYFSQQEEELTNQAEKFSRFLYKLEQEKSISQEERDSYIGIYRLIRQVEKGDRRAIGRLVDDGRELSFANLLSAVRTAKKKPIDLAVDDNFGAIKTMEERGVSISDQINSYFALQEKEELENSYISMQYQAFQEDIGVSSEYVDLLLESGQQVTADNLSAMKQLIENRGELYRNVKQKLNAEIADMADLPELPSFEELMNQVQEQFTGAETAQQAVMDMTDRVNEFLKEAMFAGDNDYLDIKAITAMSKQLSLVNRMSGQQVFELPAVIDGELTSVNIRFAGRDKAEEPQARVTIHLTDGTQIIASFMQEKEQIKGYVGCNGDAVKEKIEQKTQNFYKSILSETGKTADIAIVRSDILDEISGLKKQAAWKQMLVHNQGQAEQSQGRAVDAGALYQTVKSFIKLFE